MGKLFKILSDFWQENDNWAIPNIKYYYYKRLQAYGYISNRDPS